MSSKLLACKFITQEARGELQRAGAIHKDVPGLPDDVEIAEIPYDSDKDINIMSVWDVPREIDVYSRELHFYYQYVESIEGYALSDIRVAEDIEEVVRRANEPVEQLDLGDLEDHPF